MEQPKVKTSPRLRTTTTLPRWTPSLPPTATLSFLEILKHVSCCSTLANLGLQKTSFKMWSVDQYKSIHIPSMACHSRSGTGTAVTVIWWKHSKRTIVLLESAGPRSHLSFSDDEITTNQPHHHHHPPTSHHHHDNDPKLHQL